MARLETCTGAKTRAADHKPRQYMVRTGMRLLLLMLLWSCCSCEMTGAESAVQTDFPAKLRELRPLPKVHYSWGLSRQLLDDRNSRTLYELARITHALCLFGESCTQTQVDNCAYTCARINKTDPKITARIGLNFSPWHRRFGKDLPPANKGPTYHEELQFLDSRMQKVKQWLEQSNHKYQTDVKIGAVLLDSERFHIKSDDDAWNRAVREKLNDVHKLATAIYPAAKIEWFGRGITRIWGGNGWGRMPYFTGREIKAPLSCQLYSIPEIERMRETYRRTTILAEEIGVDEVTPWVALGAGYRRGIRKKQYWDFHWDYNLIYSYQIGAELNIAWYAQQASRFAPYDKAKVIVFYPAPFDQRVTAWTKHFIAYVRGATGVQELGDLGWTETQN